VVKCKASVSSRGRLAIAATLHHQQTFRKVARANAHICFALRTQMAMQNEFYDVVKISLK